MDQPDATGFDETIGLITDIARSPEFGPRSGRPGARRRVPEVADDELGPFEAPSLGPLPKGADGWVRLAAGCRAIPHYSRFQPRDRHGLPIKLYRWELMTMAQRRACYTVPRDRALEAIAVAEEEAMIAEERAKGGG